MNSSSRRRTRRDKRQHRSRHSANRRIVGLVLGSAVVGIGGVASTKKGRSWRRRRWNRMTKNAGYVATGAQRAGRALNNLFRKK